METVKGVKRGEGDGVEIIQRFEIVKRDCGDYVVKRGEGDGVEIIQRFEIVKRDCGDYVEILHRDVLPEGDDAAVIFSWDNIPDRLQIDRLQKDGRRVLYAIPGFSLKFPKKLPQNFSLYDMKDQVKEAKLKFLAAVNEAMSKLYPDHFTELVLDDKADVITGGLKPKQSPCANELKADNMEK